MTHLNIRFLTLLAAVNLTALPACASSQVTPQIKPGATMTADAGHDFIVWKEGFMQRALQKGYDQELVNRLIGPAKLSPVVITRDQTQPEFTRPVWAYIESAVSADRLNQGQTELAKHQAVFEAIDTRYKVDRHILTAIWGLESAYGRIQGNHDIVSALSTLAYEGRRQDWAESQIFAILDIVRDGQVRPDQLKGAWAGAMGMMQFIPTTFKDYAVDFNGDGNIDIWQNEGDALASAANYLSRFGWHWGAPVSLEVTLPSDFDHGQADGRRNSVATWEALGVRPIGGQSWSDAARMMDAKLLLPAGHRGPKLLTFKNFDVIKRYNNSTSYALGIHNLAESLKGRRAITTSWPKSDKPLSRTDKEEMQKRLTALGFDTKGVDGQIGPNTRRAIRGWQRANGVPADGYVEQTLFARIMGR